MNVFYSASKTFSRNIFVQLRKLVKPDDQRSHKYLTDFKQRLTNDKPCRTLKLRRCVRFLRPILAWPTLCKLHEFKKPAQNFLVGLPPSVPICHLKL